MSLRSFRKGLTSPLLRSIRFHFSLLFGFVIFNEVSRGPEVRQTMRQVSPHERADTSAYITHKRCRQIQNNSHRVALGQRKSRELFNYASCCKMANLIR